MIEGAGQEAHSASAEAGRGSGQGNGGEQDAVLAPTDRGGAPVERAGDLDDPAVDPDADALGHRVVHLADRPDAPTTSGKERDRADRAAVVISVDRDLGVLCR